MAETREAEEAEAEEEVIEEEEEEVKVEEEVEIEEDPEEEVETPQPPLLQPSDSRLFSTKTPNLVKIIEKISREI